MTRSMTAFARQSIQQDWSHLVWEIKSVNHRYLETTFRLPEPVRHIENDLRKLLRSSLNRGKVDCTLSIHTTDHAQETELRLNQQLLQGIIAATQTIETQLGEPANISALELLKWPGIVLEQQVDNDILCDKALDGFRTALSQLMENREREGEQLQDFIAQRLSIIDSITVKVREQSPLVLEAQREKLQQRLSELSAELDSQRIEQEIVIIAQKADIEEELDRLDAHVLEVKRVLAEGKPCGRRLDFLMQELNREANTLSSKSIASSTSHAAVELKVLIEQMREQIQNIE